MRVALLVVTTVVSARVAIQSGINEQGGHAEGAFVLEPDDSSSIPITAT